jgi:hypothetical protein
MCVRKGKIEVRVCLIVGTVKDVGNYVESKPKWLGLGQNPEIRSPMENRRVISFVPGLQGALVAHDVVGRIKKPALDVVGRIKKRLSM